MSDRERLIRSIEISTRDTAQWTGRSALSKAVLDAVQRVNRAAFVPEASKHQAWANVAVPISHRQTISQPFIVALMTDLLAAQPGDRVLEIGTGSGYQAAVLAAFGAKVFSVEVIPALAERARRALEAQGYTDVMTRTGDGAQGWPENAPYDAIIVTAAALEVPESLVTQLRPGGRMVIPIGPPDGDQTLLLLEKDKAGGMSRRAVLPVRFVPLTKEGDIPSK